ncbi:MAG: tRNA (cytidine(34)-2'-O)-methyltransferase [Planctomycetia bacterium]|nr:tRNA (cytidine(34)-2'-O)-methyltransferase [Planctomycetia bacterium]
MKESLLNVVLFQPQIPHNTGAVGRTCVGVGAKLWIVRPCAFQFSDKNLKRAGLDYWPYLEWEMVDSWDDLLTKLPQTERYFFYTKFAQNSYLDQKYQPGDTLVFGCETTGLPDEFRVRYADQCVRIPICDEARCLNLSVSVGVAAFEAIRQIRSADSDF